MNIKRFTILGRTTEALKEIDEATRTRVLAILFAHHIGGITPNPEEESPEVRIVLKLISNEFANPPYPPPIEKENKQESSPQTPCKEINKERDSTPTRSSHSLKRAEELFEIFWQAYPRKVSKQPAKRKFIILMRELDEAGASKLLERMLSAIATQSRSSQWQEGERYIPHPTTWLNQGRWEDEGVAPQRSQADIERELAASYF